MVLVVQLLIQLKVRSRMRSSGNLKFDGLGKMGFESHDPVMTSRNFGRVHLAVESL